MYLRSLYLHQFRNYREGFFEFGPGINMIYGANAQGKTSLLEAIDCLICGRSFRTSQQIDLILTNTSSFLIEALFTKHTIDQKLVFTFNQKKERKILHNSTLLPTLSNLLGLIQGVIMTPDDVNLIKGAPHYRRQFIDLYIAQTDPLYVHHLTRYLKAMRHRNQLLKLKQLTSIEAWEYEMAQAAAYLSIQRHRTLAALLIHCQEFYTYLTEEKECLNLIYRSEYHHEQTENELKNFFFSQFNKYRQKELFRGYTLVGPHKDDIDIQIGGKDARFFASEGQQRSVVIALYIGMWKLLKTRADSTPLFMLDDIGMGLDQSRKQRLLEQLATFGQVFLTTTESNLLANLEVDKTLIRVPQHTD